MTTLAPPPRGSSRRPRENVYADDLREFVDHDVRPRRRPVPPRAFTPGNPNRRIRAWQVISLGLLAIVAIRVMTSSVSRSM